MDNSFSKYRFAGRLVGLTDAIGMKYSALSAEQFYSISANQREKYITAGIEKYDCYSIIKELHSRSMGIGDLSSTENQYEYKIGLREGMLVVKNDEYLPKLILPITFLSNELLNRIK